MATTTVIAVARNICEYTSKVRARARAKAIDYLHEFMPREWMLALILLAFAVDIGVVIRAVNLKRFLQDVNVDVDLLVLGESHSRVDGS